MRFYDITLSSASGLVYKPNAVGGLDLTAGGTTFTSYVNGRTDPGALNVEWDMPISFEANPQGAVWIRVWGVGLRMLVQASNLNGEYIKIRAGMKPGLPIATAASQDGQAGLILQGQIFQAFANWEGVNQTLEFIVIPASTGAGKIYNITPISGIQFSWNPGQSLSLQIYIALVGAYPEFNIPTPEILPDLQLDSAQQGTYETLQDFAAFINAQTVPKGSALSPGGSYQGVQISADGSSIYVFDGTGALSAKQLKFQDLIGQPTWIDPFNVQFKTMMRADIKLMSNVQFPIGQNGQPLIIAPYALTSPDAAFPNTPPQSKIAWLGLFTVNEIHHYANFRQSDASSWCTVFKAYTNLNSASYDDELSPIPYYGSNSG